MKGINGGIKKSLWLFPALSLFLFCTLSLGKTPSNLLQNGGFETADWTGKPVNWRLEYWQPGSKVTLISERFFQGRRALLLQSDSANDIRLVQTARLKPDTIYRFSGWAATENVSGGKTGANLCVMGGFVHSPFINGTTGWRRLELTFKTGPGEQEVTLGARLGYYSNTVTGRAYFDDLVLEESEDSNIPFQALAQTGPNIQTTDKSGANNILGPILIVLFYLLLLGGLRLRPGELNNLVNQRSGLVSKLPWIFCGLTVAAFLIRIPLFEAAPFPTDLNNFKAWALRMAETGPVSFYSHGYYCDYPPFSLYILWFVGWLAKIFSLTNNALAFSTLIKLPSFFFDVATGWLILILLRKKNPLLAIILSGIYLFLPMVIYNSAYWGQMDGYYTFFMVLTFYLLVEKKHPESASIFLAASLLTKAQTIAFIPLLIYYLFLNYDWKRRVQTILTGIATFVLIILPFNINQPITWIVDLYTKQAALYPYASFYAANFLALISGHAVNDSTPVFGGISYYVFGLILFLAGIVWSCRHYKLHNNKAGLAGALVISAFAFFMFCPRMHERYLFPVLAFLLLAVGYCRDKKLYFLAALVSLTCLLNMKAAVMYHRGSFTGAVFEEAMYVLAMANTLLFIAVLFVFHFQTGGRAEPGREYFKNLGRKIEQNLLTKLTARPFPMKKTDYLVLGVIILSYAGFIFFRLGSTEIPQTGGSLAGAGLEISFQSVPELKTMVIYDAENTGIFQVQRFANGTWNPVATINTDNFYVLKRLPLEMAGVDKLRLVPSDSGTGRINEIGFLDSSGRLAAVKSVRFLNDDSEAPAGETVFFDEQRLIAAKPSYLNSTYFDEIYHGRTAYEFVKGLPVYENTHPPLGKDLLSLGILLFGMNPFGMRFMHALAGVFLILLLFFLGRQVLATRFGAYGVMIAGIPDFMPFVQSRYASIDTFSALFIGMMFLFTFKYLREEELGLGSSLGNPAMIFVSFSLASAVKWTAIYAFAGVVFCITIVKIRQGRFYLKTLYVFLVLTLIVSLLIYYFSYIPYLNCRGITEPFSRQGVEEVINNQKGMYDYHSKLTATHPFSSPWWCWPFNFKPLWIYSGDPAAPGNKASIVSLGNPLIWLLGMVSLAVTGFLLLRSRRLSMLHYVMICFLALYLPWILVNRVTFIYHYYPLLPLLYLLIVFLAEPLWEEPRFGRKIIWPGVAFSLGLLILFYPVLSGMEVSQNYIQMLRWFPRDWFF